MGSYSGPIVSACSVVLVFSMFFVMGVLSLYNAYHPVYDGNCTTSPIIIAPDPLSPTIWLLWIGGVSLSAAALILLTYIFLLVHDYFDVAYAKYVYLIALVFALSAIIICLSFGIVGAKNLNSGWKYYCSGYTYNFVIAAVVFAFVNPVVGVSVFLICFCCLFNLS